MTSEDRPTTDQTNGSPADSSESPRATRNTPSKDHDDAGAGGRVRRVLAARESGLAAVLILVILFLVWRSPYFLTASNLTVVGRQIAMALLISIGMTFVIVSGQIDLSVGSVVALVSVLTGEFMVTLNLPPVVAVLLALLSGAVVGLVNGTIIAGSMIPSFIVTLGMLAVARGLSLGITGGQTISGFPQGFLTLGQGSALGVPIPVWIAAAAAVIAHVVLTRTAFGRHVYFLGSNEEAAVLSGIRVRRIKVAIFTIAATLAATEAVIETARLSVGQPAAGQGYELLAIGAVVIGGANLFGGEGSILGTVLGTALLGLIQDGLILLDISAYWQQVFSGAIIVIAVGLNMWRRQRQGRT